MATQELPIVHCVWLTVDLESKIGFVDDRTSATDYDNDMRQAKAVGIDAFALNIGIDGESSLPSSIFLVHTVNLRGEIGLGNGNTARSCFTSPNAGPGYLTLEFFRLYKYAARVCLRVCLFQWHECLSLL